MPISIGVCLEEDPSRCILGGISGNGEWFVWVREGEDWLFGEFLFQFVKGFLTRRSPFPFLALLSKVNEWASYVGVVSNESLVIIGKSQKQSNIFDLGGGWPVCDS